MSDLTPHVGSGDSALDQRLSDELDKHNAAATPDVRPADELTVRIEDGGHLVAGASGWTWGESAGIGMTWVHDDHRHKGLGSALLAAFENEARRRGCAHVFVTSFTFQAPDFYQRNGYKEIFRWESVPTPGRDDVHMRKDLQALVVACRDTYSEHPDLPLSGMSGSSVAALPVMASKRLTEIWVRLADWVLAEADLPRPVPGAVLCNMGIRLYGTLERVDETAEDRLVAESEPSAADPRTPVYLVAGPVESSQVLETDTGSGTQHAGLELVISVAGLRLQAQVDGDHGDIVIGSRVAIRGTLFVIGQYEWEDFGLVDTRADWKIDQILAQPDGDYLLRLAVPQAPEIGEAPAP